MSGVTSKDVFELILMTQYFDMLKDVGARGANTLFIKHGPQAVPDITKDIQQGFKTVNVHNSSCEVNVIQVIPTLWKKSEKVIIGWG